MTSSCETTSRRLVVCDPACVQPFGHNVTAMTYFKSAFSDRYSETIAVCCELLPKHIAQKHGFLSSYRFYYRDYFPSVLESSGQDYDDFNSEVYHAADPKEEVAVQDARKILAELSVGEMDDVLFPHLDFYGVVGMVRALLELPAERRPRLLLRFIGVMENATPSYRSPLDELISRIRVAKSRGVRLRVSAETPRYADFLAMRLAFPVTVTAYPDDTPQMPLAPDGPFFIYCPGSARIDKGFLGLASIFSEVRKRDPGGKIQFITQVLPDLELRKNLDYLCKLYAIPGVHLQPSTIGADLMRETYRRSHAVLLPYAVDIYELRGSAVLMEAASYGRPAITYDGTAFADLVKYYRLGAVVESETEMIDGIIELAMRDRQTIYSAAAQARHRFAIDNVASYDTWLSL